MTSADIENPRSRQEELGQFLTTSHLADFMASMFDELPPKVRLLDAGAGAGALTAAFVSHVCENPVDVIEIEATLYELDPEILDSLAETMQKCQERCTKAGVRFTSTIHPLDFILETSASLVRDLFSNEPPVFDAAIVNPPYRKISSGSAERKALRSIGIETSNLYTGFIALIQRLLVQGGQLVGITPRSFCNGPYFRPFREDFLAHLELRRLHVFESRQAAFSEDGVLQENVIFHAVKGRNQPERLVISSSSGKHGDQITESKVAFTEVVHSNDAEKFIHIPSMPSHVNAKTVMDGLTASLASLGLSVSTGRVVDFRLKDSLRKDPEHGTVPLIYPCHFSGGSVAWPKPGARKPNAILDNDHTRQWLIPSGTYLLTKRFTSKEERRRLVACLFDPNTVKAERIGFENHLNYIHSNGCGLERTLAIGLYVFLNSTLVDQYFRRFSGHTQVNATDLRALPYPNREALQAMGHDIAALNFSQDAIDELVEEHVHGSR